MPQKKILIFKISNKFDKILYPKIVYSTKLLFESLTVFCFHHNTYVFYMLAERTYVNNSVRIVRRHKGRVEVSQSRTCSENNINKLY